MAVGYGGVLARNARAARARLSLEMELTASRMRSLGFSAWRRQTVAAVEKGKRRLTAEEVLGLALALETSIGNLMDPSRDDKSVQLPSGQPIEVGTVQRSVRHFNDGMIWWEDDTPQFETVMPDREQPAEDMSSMEEFTPEMMQARHGRLASFKPKPGPYPPPPARGIPNGGDR